MSFDPTKPIDPVHNNPVPPHLRGEEAPAPEEPPEPEHRVRDHKRDMALLREYLDGQRKEPRLRFAGLGERHGLSEREVADAIQRALPDDLDLASAIAQYLRVVDTYAVDPRPGALRDLGDRERFRAFLLSATMGRVHELLAKVEAEEGTHVVLQLLDAEARKRGARLAQGDWG